MKRTRTWTGGDGVCSSVHLLTVAAVNAHRQPVTVLLLLLLLMMMMLMMLMSSERR